uniref:Uncharacterized protein n=1 Tax=Cucumis sativus TaxID=3659 RepID=A0A0A0KN14_CUCSA
MHDSCGRLPTRVFKCQRQPPNVSLTCIPRNPTPSSYRNSSVTDINPSAVVAGQRILFAEFLPFRLHAIHHRPNILFAQFRRVTPGGALVMIVGIATEKSLAPTRRQFPTFSHYSRKMISIKQ